MIQAGPEGKKSGSKKEKKTSFRKREELGAVLKKIKLWASRNGTLHGIQTIGPKGAYIDFKTHCGQKERIKNSKTSRAGRWLRNKWYVRACPRCKIPAWKLRKYSLTSFK